MMQSLLFDNVSLFIPFYSFYNIALFALPDLNGSAISHLFNFNNVSPRIPLNLYYLDVKAFPFLNGKACLHLFWKPYRHLLPRFLYAVGLDIVPLPSC